MEQKRMTATEREALMRLAIAEQILCREADDVQKRLGMIPGARRDMGLMKTLIEKLMRNIQETVPTEQLLSYQRSLADASYVIGVRCRATDGNREKRNKEIGMWVSYEALNAILEGCHDHCMMCELDKVSQMKCKLKKALDSIPNDKVDKVESGCPYFGEL